MTINQLDEIIISFADIISNGAGEYVPFGIAKDWDESIAEEALDDSKDPKKYVESHKAWIDDLRLMELTDTVMNKVLRSEPALYFKNRWYRRRSLEKYAPEMFSALIDVVQDDPRVFFDNFTKYKMIGEEIDVNFPALFISSARSLATKYPLESLVKYQIHRYTRLRPLLTSLHRNVFKALQQESMKELSGELFDRDLMVQLDDLERRIRIANPEYYKQIRGE